MTLFWICGFATAGKTTIDFDGFSYRDGLSQNGVTAILQDRNGFLWIGTTDGLNRYDGYRFKVFEHDPEDPWSLSGNTVKGLAEDRDGGIWVVTFGEGLNRYDPGSGRFHRFEGEDTLSKHLGAAHCLLADKDGNIWIGSGYGLYVGDPGTLTFARRLDRPDDPIRLEANVLSLVQSGDGDLWIGTYKQGLIRWDPDSGEMVHFRSTADDPLERLANDVVLELYEDRDGQIWIGTRDGVDRFDPATGGVVHYPDATKGLHVEAITRDSRGRLWLGSKNGQMHLYDDEDDDFKAVVTSGAAAEGFGQIRCFLEDRGGLLWVGASNGLFRHDLEALPVAIYKAGSPGGGLPHDSVQAITEDEGGDLWVGTTAGLSRRLAGDGGFDHFLHDPDNPESLGNNMVFSLLSTRAGDLWVGTARGLNRKDPERDGFARYRHDPEVPESLGHDFVTALAEDTSARVWVGTLEGGLHRYLPEIDGFKPYRAADTGLPGNVIYALLPDPDGTLWVGTMTGLGRLDDRADRCEVYRHDPDDPATLSHAHINAIVLGRNGELWLATRLGLDRLDRESGEITRFGRQNGLGLDPIWGILEDGVGRLWISTSRGLAALEPGRDVFQSYDYRDGLPDGSFNYNGYYRGATGKLYFGNSEGLVVLDPERVSPRSYRANTVLTELLLDNRTIQPSEARDSPLSGPLPATRRIVLSHRQRMLGIEFAALDFAQPDRTVYAYTMEGFDGDWITTDAANRRATYTGLPAGDYRFRVKSKARGGQWHEATHGLAVRVLPAPWASLWAKLLYAALAVALLALYLRLQRDKLRRERLIAEQQRQIADQERERAAHLARVDQLKDEFLTNTSHELRTPLNGIIGLAEALLEDAADKLTPPMATNLTMIAQSGKKLASLVNDLLDFAKIRNDELALSLSPVDVRVAADVVVNVCQPLARGKNLVLHNAIPEDLPPVLADEDRLQQILFNLVGNAIKFTERGSVTVTAEREGETVVIAVTDTGIGIPADRQEAIFAEFFQLDGSETRARGGTGLGLAITRQLVQLHGGALTVDSEPGRGSRFAFGMSITTASMPSPSSDIEAAELLTVTVDEVAGLPRLQAVEDESVFHHFRVLVVDDDPINRRVLANHLAPRCYEVVEAGDGPEALRYFDETAFDLVILDVMMPGMSGFQVCRKLREEHHRQDLPILFLTAKTSVSDLVTAFTQGANDYLTKPVARDELIMRVKTHLQLLDLHRGMEAKVTERTRALMQTQKQLIEAAHQAGMAEIASNTLHEIGNTLNSAGVSLQLLTETCENNRSLALLTRTVDLLEGGGSLTDHLHAHPKGGGLMALVSNCTGSLGQSWASIRREIGRLREHTDGIQAVLQKQREWVHRERDWQILDLNYLIRDQLNGERAYLEAIDIELHLHLGPTGPIKGDGEMITRALIYILKNAEEAIGTGMTSTGRIRVQTSLLEGDVVVTVTDNGCGVTSENLDRVFSQGFSTKPDRRGFGLHYCANAVNRMGGTIKLSSPGLNQGTSVWMSFPVAREERLVAHDQSPSHAPGV